MARRSTPRAARSKSSFYPDEVLDRIIEAGGGLPEDDREVEVLVQIESTGAALYKRATRREALRACLEGAAEQYTRSVTSAAAPTQAMLARRYAEIETAVHRSLKLLGKPGKVRSKPDRITRILHSELGLELAGGVPSLEAVAGLRVQEKIRDLEELLRCATRLRKKSGSVEPTAPAKRHSGDVPLNELIRWLGHAWFVVFEGLPGSSVDADGKVGGPFICFVRAALEPLLEEVPAKDALRPRVRRVLPSVRPRGNGQVR